MSYFYKKIDINDDIATLWHSKLAWFYSSRIKASLTYSNTETDDVLAFTATAVPFCPASISYKRKGRQACDPQSNMCQLPMITVTFRLGYGMYLRGHFQEKSTNYLVEKLSNFWLFILPRTMDFKRKKFPKKNGQFLTYFHIHFVWTITKLKPKIYKINWGDFSFFKLIVLVILSSHNPKWIVLKKRTFFWKPQCEEFFNEL